MADEEMRMELERLRSENAALKHVSAKGLALKVSEKGALSVYGLGRFPVTLYKEQWVKLLAMAEEIKVFLKANDSQLKAKLRGESGGRIVLWQKHFQFHSLLFLDEIIKSISRCFR